MEKQTPNPTAPPVPTFNELDKVLDDLIEEQLEAVQHNDEVIERKTHKEAEDNKQRKAKIEEYRQAKEQLMQAKEAMNKQQVK